MKSTLIGHSFGGIIASLFAEKYPEEIQSIILVGAPVSLQETFKIILESSKNIYQKKSNIINLKFIFMHEMMDNIPIEYNSYCFMHAMHNGFYSTKNPTEETKNIYSKYKSDTFLQNILLR